MCGRNRKQVRPRKRARSIASREPRRNGRPPTRRSPAAGAAVLTTAGATHGGFEIDNCIRPDGTLQEARGLASRNGGAAERGAVLGQAFPFGNSFGHLVLHLTGNLNYYIGAQIAGTGYVRDRPLEFSDATRQPKAEVLKKFDQAIEVVTSAINSQTADDWSKQYTAVGVDARDRFDIVLQCATHLHHHMGQMLYLGF